MSGPRYDLNGDEPLPPIEGPQLAPFKDRKKRVDVLELISPHPTEYSTSGGHAHVFRVRINHEEYALKVFKFFSIAQGREDILEFANHKVDDLTFMFHSDPFFAECRAYGRIQKLERERARRLKRPELSVPCYGFLGLPTNMYAHVFEEKFGISDWDRPDYDEARPIEQQFALRALVKKLVHIDVALRDGRKMLNDLKHLRSHDIYQRDVHERNYADGLILDFSSAWTEPHWASKSISPDRLRMWRNIELGDFDKMVKRVGLKTKVRALKQKQHFEEIDPKLLRGGHYLRPRHPR